MRILRPFLDLFRRYLVVDLLHSLMKCLLCLQLSRLVQISMCFFTKKLRIIFLMVVYERPTKGSGAIGGLSLPMRANLSASSFPAIPLCAGTQIRLTLLSKAIFLAAFKQSIVKHDVKQCESKAFK